MFIQSELRIQPPIECPEQQKPENPLFLLRQSSFPVVCLTQSYFQVGRHMVEKQPVIIGVPLFQGIYLLLALDLLLRHVRAGEERIRHIRADARQIIRVGALGEIEGNLTALGHLRQLELNRGEAARVAQAILLDVIQILRGQADARYCAGRPQPCGRRR